MLWTMRPNPQSRLVRDLSQSTTVRQHRGRAVDRALLAGSTSLRDSVTGASTLPILITVEHAIAISGLGRTMIYQLIRENKFPSTSIGRRRLIQYDAFRAFLLSTP